MEEKVTYKTLNSANVRVDNSVDSERVYNISANASIDGMGSGSTNNVNGIDSGDVRRKDDDVMVASFSHYGNLNINFQVVDVAEMCAIINAVNAFITDLKAKVKTVSPVSL